MADLYDHSDLVPDATYRERVLDWASGVSDDWELFERLVAQCDAATLERAFGRHLSAAGYATTEREERERATVCEHCGRHDCACDSAFELAGDR